MGSKQKQTQMERRAQYEKKLEKRLAYLTANGVEAARIEKDSLVKKLRADLRAVDVRLNTIAANEKKTEERGRLKAEKEQAAAAPAPKEESAKAPAKKKEKASEEVKVKKEKVKKEPKEESQPAS